MPKGWLVDITMVSGVVKEHIKVFLGITTMAKIDPGKRKSGPHALRSSLASSMVNSDICYETVRKVLEHSSKSAIKHYARIDIESLRRYSLMPPLPTEEFREFLYTPTFNSIKTPPPFEPRRYGNLHRFPSVPQIKRYICYASIMIDTTFK